MYGTKCNVNYGFTNDLFQTEVPPRIRQAFKNFCEPLHVYDEIIMSEPDFISKYKGANILILGGGGTTQRWLNQAPDLSCYDFIWSINNFFKNDFIRENVHVDLFTVGPGVNLQDEQLRWYLHHHKTIAAFELHQKWARDFRNSETGQMPEELWKEADEFYDNSRKCVFQTKFYSQLGGGVRLIIYGAHLGVNSIDFVGFDGPIAIAKGDHAFEQGKRAFPGAVQYMGQAQKEMLFQIQYDVFWKYIKNLFPSLATKDLTGNPLHARHN